MADNPYDSFKSFRFNSLQAIIDFVATIDANVLKGMGLQVVTTNGHEVVPLTPTGITWDSLDDALKERITRKIQIANTAPDMSHTFNFLAKDTENSHVYEFPQV